MNRMHKALDNLKLEGQKASRVQPSRQAVAPRVAAALRSKVAAGNLLFDVPSPPSLLFSAPLMAGHECDVLSVHEKQSLPVEVQKRNDAPKLQETTTSIAILGDDCGQEASPARHEDQNNAVFASLAFEAERPSVAEIGPVEIGSAEAPIPAPIAKTVEAADEGKTVGAQPAVAPADILMNAIVLKRPTRTFRLDRQPVDQLSAVETPADPISPETTPGTKGSSETQATEWELESSRELADPVLYRQYMELLRSIRRDVRGTKSPVIAFCGIDADAQTADMIHRLATIASKGGTANILLVDANRAAPRVTGELNLDDALGIVSALSRDIPVEALIRPTSQSGIFVVPLGNGVVEHLGAARRRLASLVQRWKQDYSMVLMDVGAMSGPLAGLFSAACDGAYVSVQLGETLVVEAERRIKQFRTDGVNLLGCVALQPQ